MYITAFQSAPFHYAKGFRVCSSILKCIRQLHAAFFAHSSCDERIVLLCLSAESNPIRIADVFGQGGFSSNREFDYWWEGVEHQMEQLAVDTGFSVSEEGELCATTGYHYVLFTFGVEYSAWAKQEVANCLQKLAITCVSSPKSAVVLPLLQLLTAEYVALKSSLFDRSLDVAITDEEWIAAIDNPDIAMSDISKFSRLHMKRLKALFVSYVLNGDININDESIKGQWITMTDDAIPTQYFSSEDAAFDAGGDRNHLPPRIFTAQIGGELPLSCDLSKPDLGDLLLLPSEEVLSSHTIPFFLR
jgi:hypothetical protein